MNVVIPHLLLEGIQSTLEESIKNLSIEQLYASLREHLRIFRLLDDQNKWLLKEAEEKAEQILPSNLKHSDFKCYNLFRGVSALMKGKRSFIFEMFFLHHLNNYFNLIN
ncbi:MAG: hypothetical protein JEY91_03525 [Spirochaetaceae bacterium]|nr:hypothetical protein [Spirochaetaceae bacterium]